MGMPLPAISTFSLSSFKGLYTEFGIAPSIAPKEMFPILGAMLCFRVEYSKEFLLSHTAT